MDLLSLMSERYSVRRYQSRPVPQEAVDRIVQAGQLAPTAHNEQPQQIFVVNSAKGLSLLAKCTVCRYGAPLAFLICYDKDRAWVREYDGKCSGDVDAAIVTTHMMLEAQSLGLGTTWIMYFIPEAVKTEFTLPENIVPTAILYAGYADDAPSAAHRSRRTDNVTRR